MKLQQKMETLGFDEKILSFIEEQGPSALEVLALIQPEQAYYFYQHYSAGREIQDLARSNGKTTKAVQRALHGWRHAGAEVLGAEDWFLLILQIFFEADRLLDAAETVSCCFTEAVTGSTAPMRVPFHRAFLRILCAAMTPYDPAQALPWTKSAERASATPSQLCHILWPAFRLPLKHDMFPGLLAVLHSASSAERRWLCLLSLFLAEQEPVWGDLLRLLNSPNDSAALTQEAQRLIHSLSHRFDRHAALALLAKTPCVWSDLADQDLSNLECDDRVTICAKIAVAHLPR